MRDEVGTASGRVPCTRDGAADSTVIVLQPRKLRQDFLLSTEQSSERSSQEDWAIGNQVRLISHGSHDGSWTGSGLMSSHGSIGAAGKGELQEQACTSASPSLDQSGSCGRDVGGLRAACEDADATSMDPYTSQAGPRTRLRGGAVPQAGAAEAPAQSAGFEELLPAEGSTAKERADSALRMARAAAADAQQKARHALDAIAAAQQRRAAEERPAKRKRRQVLKAYAGPPSHLLLGARISVFWPDDDAFYKGRIVEVREDGEEARVVYDDEMEEWLALASERFRWLAPRAASAGGTRALQAEMARLGAEGVSDAPHAPDTAAAPLQGEPAPPDSRAVGGCIALHFAGGGAWCSAEVLAYDDVREMHYLVYEDGEHEWVCLRKEAHQWTRPQPGSSHHAGLGQGAAVPSEAEAIGWRVGTYWPESATFYEGEVIGYDNASGRHHLVYDSGEQEHVHLAFVKVRWVMPPSVNASQSSAGRVSFARGFLHQKALPAFCAAASGSPDSGRSSRRSSAAVAKKGRPACVRELPMKSSSARTQLKAWLKDELPEAADADAQLLGFGDMGSLAADLCRDDFGGTQRAVWWQQQPKLIPRAASAARDRRTHNGTLAARALFPAEGGGWPMMGPPPAGARHVSMLACGSAAERLQEGTSALPTAASLQLDELISELADAGDSLGGAEVAVGADCSVEPISAGLGLEPLDLSLPILPDLARLGSDGLRGLLLEGLSQLPAGAAGALGSATITCDAAGVAGASEHGSTAAESLLQGGKGSGAPTDAPQGGAEGGLSRLGSEAGVAQVLSAESGLLGEAGGEGAGAAPKEEFGGQALTLASARSSIMSLASDSTAVGIGSCHSSTHFHSGTPAAPAAPTPESIRVARPWEEGSQLCAPLEPLHTSQPMEQQRIDARTNDGLVMTNELQRLLADMDWG